MKPYFDWKPSARKLNIAIMLPLKDERVEHILPSAALYKWPHEDKRPT